MEYLIRANKAEISGAAIKEPGELDRYFTAPSDPAQEKAVFRARQPTGLVVQGPPGTGKSQTIVNIVCDAIGRRERVLVFAKRWPH